MLTFRFSGSSGEMTEQEQLTSGMVGKQLLLEFSPEWDSLGKTVVFSNGNVVQDVIYTGTPVTIPARVLERPLENLYVGVYGVSADGKLVIPTIRAKGPEILPGVDPSGDPGTDSDLPVWAQLQAAMGELADLQTENRDSLVSAINEVAGRNPGESGQGENGATFTPAVSEDGVLSWTNDRGLENPAPVKILGPAGPKGNPGKDGNDGAAGKDGVSATHSWNGTVLTVTSASGTSSADLKGEKGEKGDKGDEGIQGARGEPGEKGEDGPMGKTAYQYAQDGGYTGTEAEFAEKLANEYTRNPLYGKKISLIGDSICAGADDETSYLGGYGKIIADRNNMRYENFGKAGSTITAETYSHSTGAAKGWICRMVANMDAGADYAIVEGGYNDAWQWVSHGDITIGAISEGYNAELDDTTYYGAFESMLKQLVTKFQGKKIGYIALPKMMDFFDSNRNAPNFYHIALECCAKWGVPVCDLNTMIPPAEYLKTLGTTYTADGSHPTYEGYLKYYCDPIENWMKTLITGGNNAAAAARKTIEDYTRGFSDAIEALQKGKLDNTGVSFKKAKLPLADGTTIVIDVLTAIDGTVVIPFINQVPISIDTDGSSFNGTGYMKGYRLSSTGAIKEQAGSYVTGYIPAEMGDVIRIWGCEWGTTMNAHSYICAYDSSFAYIGGAATSAGASTLTLVDHTATVVNNYSADEKGDTTLTVCANDTAYIRVCSRGFTTTTEYRFDPNNMIVTVNEEIN